MAVLSWRRRRCADRQKFTHSRQTGHLRWSAQPAARLDISSSLKNIRSVDLGAAVCSQERETNLYCQTDSSSLFSCVPPQSFSRLFIFHPSCSFQSRRLRGREMIRWRLSWAPHARRFQTRAFSFLVDRHVSACRCVKCDPDTDVRDHLAHLVRRM